MSNINDYLKDYWTKEPKCKECGFVFACTPSYPDSHEYVTQQGPYGPRKVYVVKPKAQYDAETAVYNIERPLWEKTIKEHLTTHPLGDCDHCGSVVKRSGLKSHQKSFACKEAQRKKSVEDLDYKNVNSHYKYVKEIFEVIAKPLFDSLEFDDVETRRMLSREKTKALELFEDLGRIVLCATTYNRINPNLSKADPLQGWQQVAWAPRETATALKILYDKARATKVEDHPKSHSSAANHPGWVFEMWEWLLSGEEERYAALGFWELQQESK